MVRVNTQNGNFQWNALVLFPRLFPEDIESKAIESKRPGTSALFHSEIPFGNFGLPFKKSRFPERISVLGDKINLSNYIPSEISGIKQPQSQIFSCASYFRCVCKIDIETSKSKQY